MHVPLFRPYYDEKEQEAIAKAVKRRLIGSGPFVAAFEKEFAAYVDAPYALALSSCTAALHVALEACNIGPGDQVITTPLTFAATILAILYAGATPVLADIDERTRCIDPDAIERRITPRTRAIVPVHYAGYPCQLDALYNLCWKHDLALVEDAAHAALTRWQGRRIGQHPPGMRSASCFSFQATKPIAIGDGGMLTTADPAIAEASAAKRLFGMNKRDGQAPGADMALQYEIMTRAYKYNLTDTAAALGRAS